MSNVSRFRICTSPVASLNMHPSGEISESIVPEPAHAASDSPSIKTDDGEYSDDLSEVIEFEKLYNPLIFNASRKYQIDPFLIKAMIIVESGCDPKAVSHSGAKGLMQLMPKTARSLGVKNILNPEHNINAGTKYFKSLLDRFRGNIKLALAAYNAGAGKVLKYQGVPPFTETAWVVDRVCRLHKVFIKREMISMQASNNPHA
jgi:hypothetical protein